MLCRVCLQYRVRSDPFLGYDILSETYVVTLTNIPKPVLKRGSDLLLYVDWTLIPHHDRELSGGTLDHAAAGVRLRNLEKAAII